MQTIINTETGEHPVSQAQVCAANPLTIFPEPFSLVEPFEWVAPVEPPTYDPLTQRLVQLAPVKASGKWKQKWKVEALAAEEMVLAQQAAAAAVISAVSAEAQARLDEFAQSRRYDNIISLCSYAGDPDPQQAAEGTRGLLVRSQTWVVLKGIERDVLAGTRPMPTLAEAVAELPPLTWAVEE